MQIRSLTLKVFCSPCQADAALFGHTYAILTTPGFKTGLHLANILRLYEPIVKHCCRIMPLLNLNSKIKEQKPHPLYKPKLVEVIEEPKTEEKSTEDEFVFSDEDNDLHKINYDKDICTIANPQNLIYNSLFK